MKKKTKNNYKKPDQNAQVTELMAEQIDLLKKQNSLLVMSHELLKDKHATLEQKHAMLEQKYDEMKVHYEWFKRQMFGKKSERFIPDSNAAQDDLFGFAGDNSDDEPATKDIGPHTRKVSKKKSSKLSFSDDVTVIKEVIDIPDEEKTCPETGEPLKCIGVDSKELLYCVPGRFMKLVIERPKYARSVETAQGPKTIVLQEKALPELIRGTKFHPSFMTYVIVQKYVFHVPLNRTIEELKYNGVTVSSQALSGLVLNLGDKLKALYDLMMKQLLKQKYLFTDDTGSKMLEKGRGQARKTYIWAYIGGEEGKPRYIIYKHSKGRTHDIPAEHLAGFQGTITSDAFGGYEKLENAPDSGISWNACWCHARRKFESCIESSKHARGIMSLMKELFIIERECWDTDAQARLAIRNDVQTEYVQAIFDEVQWMKDNLNLIPKTPLNEAVNYMLERPKVFMKFLTDSNLRIENNTAEHAMRKFVIGRKNWMFFGSENGAEAGCIIMSFAQTCRAMDINPSEYFEDVFGKLAVIDKGDEKALKKLLPDQWLKHNKPPAK